MSQMPARRKPRVVASPIANQYAAPFERIVEFSNGARTTDEYKSGLISFRNMTDGTLLVDVGHCDRGILVLGPPRPPLDQDLPRGWENQ